MIEFITQLWLACTAGALLAFAVYFGTRLALAIREEREDAILRERSRIAAKAYRARLEAKYGVAE